MLQIQGKTIPKVFEEAAANWPNWPFLVVPKGQNADSLEISYSTAIQKVNYYKNKFQLSGYSAGQRIAVLLGNNPNHYLIKLALNSLGISIVPLNPDASPKEISYILSDSNSSLIITNDQKVSLILESFFFLKTPLNFCLIEEIDTGLPPSNFKGKAKIVSPETEASLLYTSGTTGKPKGCILSHEYELMCGDSYIRAGSPVSLTVNRDKIFNPLPSFHINAGILTFFVVILTGNCLIQPNRFSVKTWSCDIRETEATVFHYLGVIIAMLLNKEIKKDDIKSLRLGLGAGVEPSLHEKFESQFAIPLVEVWGMTEMCRIIVANEEPRQINTRAMGRPRSDLEIKVVDENDKEVERGHPGEMLVRHSESYPRKGAFSGYLGNEEATEVAWRNGWFHTGDTVIMDESNMLFFVDRAKNIIRRSGENIAAAEVENCLIEHEYVKNVACISVPDELREEEIMACVVLSATARASKKTAKKLFSHVYVQLAYYKAPGWFLFLKQLPVTGTQKVLKHKLFSSDEDPRQKPNVFDMRVEKVRKN